MDEFDQTSSSSDRNSPPPPRNSPLVNINLNPDITSPSTSSSSSSIPTHNNNNNNNNNTNNDSLSSGTTSDASCVNAGGGGNLSRYENQKRRDWITFGQYLRNHRPPLSLSRCSGAHVLEFLRYLDQFGKTKVHSGPCPFFGHPSPPAPCPCPLRQAWGSLDALVGRLRAAFDENCGGSPEANPFGARAVRLYLREVRDSQSKARGVSYEKKKRKRPAPPQEQQGPLGPAAPVAVTSSASASVSLFPSTANRP